MIRSLLVANRGEIAVRVIRAAQELGIRTVAVYSDADRDAHHVRLADKAVHIGPAPANESYLSLERIMDAARAAVVDALHPGYGFLSENPALAEACEAAGIIFIGPPAAAMRLLGDKVEAKRAMEAAGVPVLPGYHGDDQSDAALIKASEQLGYPLLVKAAGGGGGRGMRRVDDPAELRPALESARREAQSAFGDDRLLLERLLEQARHVEVQVLCDVHGAVAHLGERECSVQRHHQKVIEEAPSPVVDEALRARLGETAERVMRVAGYRGAGTVELLLGSDGRFYFMEVNARLQVEHPVTEVAWGIDLVKEQFRLAAGEPLGDLPRLPQAHAIECRLYAEDPRRHYQPSTGRLTVFEPPLGPNLRHDLGVEVGSEISPYYDPMLGKMIAWGPDRASALASTRWALSHYRIAGVTTNLSQLRWVLDHPEFTARGVTIDFVEREWTFSDPATTPTAAYAAAAMFLLNSGATWRLNNQRRTFHFITSDAEQAQATAWRHDDQWEIQVTTDPDQRPDLFRAQPPTPDPLQPSLPPSTRGLSGGTTSLRPNDPSQQQRLPPWTGEPRGVTTFLSTNDPSQQRGLPPFHGGTEGGSEDPLPALSLILHPQTGDPIQATVSPTQQGLLVQATTGDYTIALAAPPNKTSSSTAPTTGAGANRVTAPMPGRIIRLNATSGDHVRLNQPLVIMEAMKSEHTVLAPRDGRVQAVSVNAGDQVERGATLIELGDG